MINQHPVCVNDFGDEVYRCHYSDVLVTASDSVISGGMMPGIKSRYVCAKDHEAAKKHCYEAYRESEANCNNCANLIRVKHEKNKAGFLYGTCSINSEPSKTICVNTDLMKFHPYDPMHMVCWTPRK